MAIIMRVLAISIIVLLLVGNVSAASPTLSNSGGGSWEYYKEITINENSGTTLSDYQVLVQLSGSNFPTNARSDGADIRFTDTNMNELSYWIEKWDYSGKNAKIWVKVPNIPANTKLKLMMYYGNPSASSSSDGDATFMLFDDFIGASLNTNKWGLCNSPSYTLSNGLITLTSNDGIQVFRGILSLNQFTTDFIIETRGKTYSDKYFPTVGLMIERDDEVNDLDGIFTGYYHSKHTAEDSYLYINEYVGAGSTIVIEEQENDWLIITTKKSGSSVETRIYNERTGNSYDNSESIVYIHNEHHVGIAIYRITKTDYDWVFVRKYASSEPSVNFGTEQIVSTPTQTSKPTPVPIPPSVPSEYLYGGAVFAVIFLLFVALKRRKPKHTNIVHTTQPQSVLKQPEPKPVVEPEPVGTKNIDVKTAFGYKGATIQYKVKVENPTSEPIGDVKISLFVPDVFLISESTKNIPMLKPGESKTATFEIRPTGECGDCEVSGRVVYYDYSVKKTSELDIPARSLSIVCPMLHSKEIDNAGFRSLLSNLAKAEENTKEIDMPAETLFGIATRIVRDMNMYMLEPEITSTPQLYNAVARFYAEGVKNLKYAAQIEVVGGAKKSSLILKVWAENEESLTGFYHGILDEIEKRVKVKDYINDSIVQQNIHIGDKIGTQVKDSVVQRSNIGAGERKCPDCGREVESNEKFCLECGTKL